MYLIAGVAILFGTVAVVFQVESLLAEGMNVGAIVEGVIYWALVAGIALYILDGQYYSLMSLRLMSLI